MKPVPAIVEPAPIDVDEIAAAFWSLDPDDRESVLRAAGIDPGPRNWTSTGIDLGIEQWGDGDGHVFASWPEEVKRCHRVYFVQAGEKDEAGFASIKIGFTTDLPQRLRQLQTASPLPLKVVECVIGTRAIEAFLHRELRSGHIRGEWFRLQSDDIAYATMRLYEEGLST